MSDDRDLVEFEEIDHPAHRFDVLCDRHRGVGVESARTRRGEIDEVAGHVVDEMGQEFAKGRRADRPAVDEQDVGSVADDAVGGLARADVEESIGLATEQVGRFGFGHR